MILVDTCVLIDIAQGDDLWADWSATQLALWSGRGPVVITPTVFAEWSALFADVTDVDLAVTRFGLTWQESSKAALFLASQAHKQYRRRGGTRAMVLADFLIGAHAAVSRMPVLTRAPRRFQSYFTQLELVCPH